MHEQDPKSQRLPVHERIAVLALLAFFLVLSLSTRKNLQIDSQTIESQHFVVEPMVTVTIEGAVANPGVYQVKRGASLQEVLALAIPQDNADTRNVNLLAKVRKGQHIKIPCKEWISVHVESDEEPSQDMRLLKGTTLQELYSQLGKSDMLDPKQARKKLRDGQIIRCSK